MSTKFCAVLRGAPLIAACILADPAVARTVSATQATLVKTLAAAQPGDTIVLAAGGYGVIALPKKVWLQPVTIDARKAEMTGIVIRNVSGVNWLGGTVIGTVYGVTVVDASRITISGVDISAAKRGMVIGGSASDVMVQKNNLHGLQTDGIDVAGVRITLENNTITDMRPVLGDHPDGIQIASSATLQTRDITIRGNTIVGDMQGIFGRAPGLGISNVTVTGNKVTVSAPNGIVLLDSTSGVATGNTVKRIPGGKNKANMRAEGGRNTICGNVVPDVPKAPANQPC